MSEIKKEDKKEETKTKEKNEENEIEKLKKENAELKSRYWDYVSYDKKIQGILKQNELEKRELTETLQRLQAEFENFCKRIEKENGEFKKFAKAEIVKKLLPVLDSFELALKNGQRCSKDSDKIVKGMEMIYAQLFQTLEDEGLRKIEALGKKFDPYYHEVLMIGNDGNKDEDVVVEELQKGYMMNEKVLRFSKVKVNKNSGEVKNENKH